MCRQEWESKLGTPRKDLFSSLLWLGEMGHSVVWTPFFGEVEWEFRIVGTQSCQIDAKVKTNWVCSLCGLAI